MASIPPRPPRCDSFGCGDNSPTDPCCPGKQIWPELVGRKAIEAKPIIERENPKVTVVISTNDLVRIPDLCCNIVWIYVDDLRNGVITSVPRVG